MYALPSRQWSGQRPSEAGGFGQGEMGQVEMHQGELAQGVGFNVAMFWGFLLFLDLI